MNRMQHLLERGQSIWIDYIERDFISSGKLAGQISNGVRGLTSNPTIFQKAISEGPAYDADIKALAGHGKTHAGNLRIPGHQRYPRRGRCLSPALSAERGRRRLCQPRGQS